MLLDLALDRSWPRAKFADPVPARPLPDWSVIMPFFNERDWLPATLASLAAQRVPVRVVLVDNGSTDGSGALAIAEARRLGLDFEFAAELRPGKVHALATGLARVRTEFVATCDADTFYPPHYLGHAARVLRRGRTVIAGAAFVDADASAAERARAGRRICATARVLRGQCHTGGAGQAFRTAPLRASGGFDADRWGYVLEDHEVIHRVLRHGGVKGGTMGYARDLWCSPSPRPRDRASIRWTAAERLLYAVTAPVAGDWFFYGFLGPRLRRRRLSSDRIRERRFHAAGSAGREPGAGVLGATACPVC